MKKSLLVTLILVACSTTALAHSGRTDSNGGHNCSQKSVNKGLCSGYHYHKNEQLNKSSKQPIEV